MAHVELNAVVKRYGDSQVIHAVDLAIEKEEFAVFVGPSDCQIFDGDGNALGRIGS